MNNFFHNKELFYYYHPELSPLKQCVCSYHAIMQPFDFYNVHVELKLSHCFIYLLTIRRT